MERLEERLHELSQPMTVLLCSLEYGLSLDSVAEVRPVMWGALVECERLRIAVLGMQQQVRDAQLAAGRLKDAGTPQV